MVRRLRAACGANPADDLLHVLHARFVGHQHGIGGFDDDEILGADAGNQPAFGMRERRGRAFEHHVAAGHVAGSVLGRDLPDRIPRPHIRPARPQRYHHARGDRRSAAELFHHRIVDRIRRRGAERFALQPEEIAIRLAAGVGRFAGRENRRLEMPDRGEPRRGTHDEDAAIPPVLLRFDITLREFEVRLFDEAVEAGAHRACRRGQAARRDGYSRNRSPHASGRSPS